MVGLAVGEATGADTVEEEAEERRVRPAGRRPRLGQPRPHLPHGRAAAHDARGDRGAPPRAHPRAPRASARRLAARAVREGRAGRARRRRRAVPRGRPRRGRRSARRASLRPRPITSAGPTASPTSRTSWSGASTTRSSTRAARSRSSSRFHGGLGGPQTRPFILYPASFPLPDEPIVGAAAVHGLLRGWRQQLQGAELGDGPASALPQTASE